MPQQKNKIFWFLQRSLDALTRSIFKFGSLLFFASMVLMITVDTTLRYLANSPIFGGNEIVGLLLLMSLLVALPHCWRGENYIRMDLLYQRYGRLHKSLVDILSALGALTFGGLLAFRGFQTVGEYARFEKATSLLEIPLWPLSIAVFVFCGLFCVSVVITLIGSISSRRSEGGD